MSPLLSLVLLIISVLLKVNGGTHQVQPNDIIYVNGHSTDDINAGPKSAKHQINSQHFAEFNNNNQDNYYQNPHLANNQNARYIVQSSGAPTIQTIYESSSVSPVVSYHQTNSDSSSEHNSENSHKSDSTTSSNQTLFIQPQTVFINSNQGYQQHNQNQNPHEGSHGSVGNNFVVNHNAPMIIETSTPGYQTTVSSSNSDSFESSSKSSSSSSSKSSSQFNSQATTSNPFYQPQITQVTTPHSVRFDNNPQGIIAGSSTYLPPVQTSYQSSYPAPTLQSFESSSQSSSDSQSHSESSSKSNKKTSSVTTIIGSDIPQSHSVSMSVTPTPYIVSVSTPQTYEISHPPVPITPIASVHPAAPVQPVPTPQTYEISHPTVPITPIAPVHPHIPVQPVPTPQTYEISHPPAPIQPVHTSVRIQPVPVYKPMFQPAPFAVPVGHNYNPNPPPVTQHVQVYPPISVLKPTIHPAAFIPATPHINHSPSLQPAIYHTPAVTEIPVTEDQEHRGVVEKTVNIPQPGIKTQTYEIRRPAIQKQFYDIEERVIVRPAGSVVVEIDQPLSKTAKGDEVIVHNGGGAGQHHGISEGHSNGVVYTQGTSHGHNGETSHGQTEKQDGLSEGHNSGVYTHGINHNNGAVYTGNHGNNQFITAGGTNYQHVVGGFGYYSYPNICDQYSQQFTAAPFVQIHHPSIGYVNQQFQPSNHGVTSTTSHPILSTTTAPLNNNNDDSVVINARYQQPSAKYIDSVTQSSQISSITTEGPISHNAKQEQTLQPSQQPIPTRNSNIRQMPHMIAVGDPDFQSPPYVEIQPNSEADNKINTNNIQNQQQTAIRGDLHNTGANTLYTMQSVMNDEYLNQQQNQQPQFINQQSQINFNQQQQLDPNQQIQNNSAPYIVYAISARNPNNHIAPTQQRQIVFPQQNSAIQQIQSQYNPAYRQQIIQSPQHYNNQHFTPQHSAAYTTSGNQQIISHSPVAYSSSYYNQRIPNTPINVQFSPYTQDPRQHHHYTQNIPIGVNQEQYKNPRLNTAPSVFPQQEYEKHSASYTQPQNFQQQYPSQQVNYAQNAALTQAPQNNVDNFEQQFPAQQLFNNQNNQPSQSQILGNQNQQNFSPQTNNTQSNQGSPIKISFNESDSYPIIDIRNSINYTNGNEQQFSGSIQPSQIVPYNNTKFNGNFNETNNQGYNNNPSNTGFRGDIQQQEDSQPQSSSISGQYENGPKVNINYQPNENQKQLLNLILSHQGSSGNNYQDLTSNSHVISATPAPKNSEPASERVQTRRIVVNQPLETVQVVQEQVPITNYEQLKVQQPTVYKTSKVGLERTESSAPIFIQPQHLPRYETIQYNNHHQPISYSFINRQ